MCKFEYGLKCRHNIVANGSFCLIFHLLCVRKCYSFLFDSTEETKNSTSKKSATHIRACVKIESFVRVVSVCVCILYLNLMLKHFVKCHLCERATAHLFTLNDDGNQSPYIKTLANKFKYTNFFICLARHHHTYSFPFDFLFFSRLRFTYFFLHFPKQR